MEKLFCHIASETTVEEEEEGMRREGKGGEVRGRKEGEE